MGVLGDAVRGYIKKKVDEKATAIEDKVDRVLKTLGA